MQKLKTVLIVAILALIILYSGVCYAIDQELLTNKVGSDIIRWASFITGIIFMVMAYLIAEYTTRK